MPVINEDRDPHEANKLFYTALPNGWMMAPDFTIIEEYERRAKEYPNNKSSEDFKGYKNIDHGALSTSSRAFLIQRQTTTNSRLVVPAQPVDTTRPGALSLQFSRGGTICLAVLGQNLARAAFCCSNPNKRVWRLFSMSGGF
jgi:hypothetical protein